MGEFAGGQVREIQSADPLSVVGLALAKQGRTRLVIANLTSRPQSLSIRGLAPGVAAVFRLDRENVASAKSDPEAFRQRMGQGLAVTGKEVELRLPAFGIARIDQGG